MSKRSGKVRRTERFRYLVDDPSAAREAADGARLAELRARGTEGHAEAVKALQSASEAVDACYGSIVFRALSPTQHEVFAQKYAERSAEREAVVKAAKDADEPVPDEPPVSWDADSLDVQLLAACDLDNDHTAKWWAEEFAGDEWTIPEREEMVRICLTLNAPRQSFDMGVLGKG